MGAHAIQATTPPVAAHEVVMGVTPRALWHREGDLVDVPVDE